MRKLAILALMASLMLVMTAGVAAAKGKPATKKVQTVGYVFEGTVASVDDNAVTVDVQNGNYFAKPFFGQQVTFATTAKTKIRLDNAKTSLSQLEAGDLVVVKAKAPKGATSFTADVLSATTPPAPTP